MQLFIDSANLDEIREAATWGIISGVTTNPSLIAKEGRDFRTVIAEICALIPGPISAECVTPTASEMIEEGRSLAAWHPNVVVKIPMTVEGIKAVRTLSAEGIRTNVTLVFSGNQAMVAAIAGATFVSPFVGRIDDAGGNGMDLIGEIRQIFDNYVYATQILTASVRHPVHVAQAARLGSDVATCPFKVLRQLFDHPLTDVGLDKFLADWRKLESRA